ncbi:MAG: hypothetical protein DHS20C11_06910 [Lysobacteraceae bacterium]|nr:MAG: hypothetical protein DHS20C11_06910 [Xanthomonadaceae bacterium]
MILRITVILLVLANLAVAGLQQMDPESSTAEPAFQAVEPGVPALVLLNERDPAIVARQRLRSSREQLVCYSVGPLPSQADARRVANGLSEATEATRERLSHVTRERGFWIYLPALPSREEALEQARRLATAGVRDYYVVTAGDRENTISLGLYGQRENALRRQASLIALGFNAEFSIRHEERPEYWVDYAITPEQAPSWQPLVARYPNVELQPADCF